MTLHQEQHLQQIKDQFNSLVDAKFRKGAVEHGGDILLDPPLLTLIDLALEEAIDQVTYLLTLRMKFIRTFDPRERREGERPNV